MELTNPKLNERYQRILAVRHAVRDLLEYEWHTQPFLSTEAKEWLNDDPLLMELALAIASDETQTRED